MVFGVFMIRSGHFRQCSVRHFTRLVMVLGGPFIQNYPVQADQSSDVTLRDVAGLDHVVDELQEVITFLKNPEKFEAMGARPPRVSLRVLGHWKSWLCSCLTCRLSVQSLASLLKRWPGGWHASSTKRLYPLIFFRYGNPPFLHVRPIEQRTFLLRKASNGTSQALQLLVCRLAVHGSGPAELDLCPGLLKSPGVECPVEGLDTFRVLVQRATTTRALCCHLHYPIMFANKTQV